MGTSSNWFKVIRRKFAKSSASRDIIVVYSNTDSNSQDETIATQEEETANLLNEIARASTTSQTRALTKEDIAAIKIQAHFRSHLARRAFRALRSLVKLQAMVRGVLVRKQARIAMHCMHALVRLQVSVRARQLLSGGVDERSTLHGRLC